MQPATPWFTVTPSPCGHERVDDDRRPSLQWHRRMTGNLARRHRLPVMVFWRDNEHDGVVVDWLRAQAGLVPIEGLRASRHGRVAGGISAPGSHGSVRDSLPSYGSCCPDHLVAGFAQAQCAKYLGWDAAACLIDWVAFFQVLSFLYLFMIHRNR